MKFCARCKAETQRYKKDNRCMPCRQRWQRERRKLHPVRYRAYDNSPERRGRNRLWEQAHPEQHEKLRRRHRGHPEPTRPCPEFCEWPGCIRKATHLDHCHSTETFRGWLCHHHNSGMGLIGDSMEDMLAGVDYLTRAQSEAWLAIPGHGLPKIRKTSS